MGWVTLTQRKMELKHSHAQLTYRNLQIAREKRQMAREKTFETLKIQTAQKKAERKVKADFYAKKEQLEKQKDYLKAYLAQAKAIQAGQLSIPTSTTTTYDANGNAKQVYLVTGNAVNVNNADYVLGVDGKPIQATCSGGAYNLINSGNVPVPGPNLTVETLAPGSLRIENITGNKAFVRINTSSGEWEAFASGAGTEISVPAQYAQEFTTDEVNFDTSLVSLPAGVPSSLTSINTDTDIKAIEDAIDDAVEDIQNDLDEANLEYQEDINDTKSEFEFELNMHEEEAMDEELQLEEEQTRIETELESISAELQAIDGAASQAIQSSTIKLA